METGSSDFADVFRPFGVVFIQVFLMTSSQKSETALNWYCMKHLASGHGFFGLE